MPTPPALRPTRVWDLPTRLFHWVLALAVVVSIASAHIGGNAMAWHFRCGYLVFALLGFRIVWGFVGGHWSRFANFLHGPAAIRRHLRGETLPGEWADVGHNPLGSLSVFALLVLLVLQVASGLVADDEIANKGPLNRFVSDHLAGLASSWHADIAQWIIIALVVLHVGAIAWYRLRRGKDLVTPMIRGDKLLPAEVPASADGAGRRLLALFILALAAAAVRWVVSLGD